MSWTRVRRYAWELASNEFQGKAMLQETNNGFIASIQVKNQDFDMELLNERDFFERKQDALVFLETRMEKHSYS